MKLRLMVFLALAAAMAVAPDPVEKREEGSWMSRRELTGRTMPGPLKRSFPILGPYKGGKPSTFHGPPPPSSGARPPFSGGAIPW
mgnify:CR=1 FL=1